MSLETDLLIDRRRLKRRLFLWRAAAVLAVASCILLAIAPYLPLGGRAHLARLSVTGLITENRKLTEAVAALAKDDAVRGLIVYVDSPGGSVAGGESLHQAISEVAARKPVVTVMGGTAASAGYMIAVPAARIFARASTLTGSIGVLLETGEVVGPARAHRHQRHGDHLGSAEGPAELHPPDLAAGPRGAAGAGDGHV